ncbi:hypothetical protein BpHYR1_024264 [Brachionus plicatilis]|uniref:Uncharacterized protein n=1 Tax=Brachionus plicatilis TaxID=10195 RepID=A0A3M7P8H6_BRAPC|nr:hypothetical protein BpHYR1_024264 [Brachionus plicatilis]
MDKPANLPEARPINNNNYIRIDEIRRNNTRKSKALNSLSKSLGLGLDSFKNEGVIIRETLSSLILLWSLHTALLNVDSLALCKFECSIDLVTIFNSKKVRSNLARSWFWNSRDSNLKPKKNFGQDKTCIIFLNELGFYSFALCTLS